MKKLYVSIVCIVLFWFSSHSQINEGFEGAFPPSGWELINGGSVYNWEQNTTYGGFGLSSNSASFNNHPGSQPTNTWYVLRCPNMILTGSSSPTLEFDVAYARYSNTQKDILRLFYSLDGVSGWIVFKTYTAETIATAPDTTNEFTPTNIQWQTFLVDLSQFNGENFIRFAFELNPDPDGGNIIYIDNVKFADTVLATNTDLQIDDFNLFPNPSTGKIQMNTSIQNLNKNNFRIINILGRSLNNFSVNQNNSGYQLNLDNLKKGIYFITINSINQSETKKIIIQ